MDSWGSDRYAHAISEEFYYVLPVDQWSIQGAASTVLRWDYDTGRGELLTLYDKAKPHQWDAASRIEWWQDLDPENAAGLGDRVVSF